MTYFKSFIGAFLCLLLIICFNGQANAIDYPAGSAKSKVKLTGDQSTKVLTTGQNNACYYTGTELSTAVTVTVDASIEDGQEIDFAATTQTINITPTLNTNIYGVGTSDAGSFTGYCIQMLTNSYCRLTQISSTAFMLAISPTRMNLKKGSTADILEP